MSTDDDHARDISRVTQWLLETDSVEEFLQALTDVALELSHAEGVGLTLQRKGRPLTVVSAGSRASDLDEKQYGQGDGPCLQALRTGEEVRVDDMLEERRWGSYSRYAVACGIRSSLSLPIGAGTDTAGALNLYAVLPGAFDEVDLTALRALITQATGAVALAQRVTDRREHADQIQDGLHYRGVINQAVGVIMAQRRCAVGEAFTVLWSASQRRNVKLRDVCTELIASFAD